MDKTINRIKCTQEIIAMLTVITTEAYYRGDRAYATALKTLLTEQLRQQELFIKELHEDVII